VIDQFLNRITRHRRLSLFWVLALIGTVGPWSCEGLKRQTSMWSKDCRVASIHDGDTLRAECGGEQLQVRLHCIDAPELEQRPWGLESRDHLRSLIPSGTHIELRVEDKDRYGRTVADLFRPGEETSVNLAMVRDGQAAVYRAFCEDRRFDQAEAQAGQAKLGIWTQPGLQQRPWEYRGR